MLDVLRRLVLEVAAAGDVHDALLLIVRRVKEAMGVDACSVYLREEPGGDYVLMATDGLTQSAVGQVRLKPDQGIVSFAGERQELVNLEDAATHPRYRFSPRTGEQQYAALLAAPILHYRRTVGVLVVRQRKCRSFNEDEEALLVTVAAQLASVINEARTGPRAIGLTAGGGATAWLVQGIAGAPGVGIGTVVLPCPLADFSSVPDRRGSDPAAEERSLREAVAAVKAELAAGRGRVAARVPADVYRLFEVYDAFLADGRLLTATVERIHEGSWAPAALRDTVLELARAFEAMDDAYLRARAEDVRAVGRRILMRLQTAEGERREYPPRGVLLGEEVSIARIAEVPSGQLAGIASVHGSALSHTAIMAQALGIPAVMGLGDLELGRLEGCEVVVDGYLGRIAVEPPPAVRAEYEHLIREDQALTAALRALRDVPAETTDGVRVRLYANTGLLTDVVPALQSGAEGIGLHRTELPFIVRASFPPEEEQYRIYRRLLDAFAPRPVTLRTLDIGGDKALPYFPIAEDNPMLGWRGIRVTLDHPEIFLAQLRAMLRANVDQGNLQVMFPMVTRVDELEQALTLLDRARSELEAEGLPVPRPATGVMIEVPSAVHWAHALARRADFLSIGTNDLTQYLLAVDRNNPRVAALYDHLDPSVLSAVQTVIERAHACGKPVSVCGQLAGEPAGAVLLIAMGVDSLSTSSASLPRVKWIVRSVSRERALALLGQALAMDNGGAVRRLLNNALIEAGLGSLIRGPDGAGGQAAGS
jgi:phosphotransferase system enzyme I (PtsP)